MLGSSELFVNNIFGKMSVYFCSLAKREMRRSMPLLCSRYDAAVSLALRFKYLRATGGFTIYVYDYYYIIEAIQMFPNIFNLRVPYS